MDKKILEQYIDACALVDEAKKELSKLKRQRKRIEQDIVKGSSPEFPYIAKNFHVEGIAYSVLRDPRSVEEQEKILQQRIDNATRIKLEVEAWMLTIPLRMQRIIKYKIFEGLSWEEAAQRISRKTTGEGLRKEFKRFMNEK